MNGNAELLNYVYQNARMGVDTLEHILTIAEGESFRKALDVQLAEYRRICASAKAHLNKYGYEEKDNPAGQKMWAGLMIDFKTLTDKSPAHIAEMMLIGSNMGIIDAIKNLRRYNDAEKEIRSLMQTLLDMEEDNVRELKKFL